MTTKNMKEIEVYLYHNKHGEPMLIKRRAGPRRNFNEIESRLEAFRKQYADNLVGVSADAFIAERRKDAENE